jgi:hypothetical protein
MIKVMIYDDGVVLAKSDFDAELMQPYQDGIALTYDQLEQLKREIQEAFRFGYGAGALAAGIGNIQDPYEVYKLYQATKKGGEG